MSELIHQQKRPNHAETTDAGSTRYPKWASFLTITLVVTLFLLLLAGAGVTSKDAGMAYPDWPTSGGYFLNPPEWLQREDTRWEHGHRLLGWWAGMTALATAAAAWRRGRSARMLGSLTLAAIALQGVLGGVRVTVDSRTLALIHGIWGQVCFCLAALAALVTSTAWRELGPPVDLRSGRTLPWMCCLGSGTIFVQLVLGAVVRHFTSGWFLVVHVLWAIPVLFLGGWIVMWVLGLGMATRIVTRTAEVFGILLVVQLALGGFAWLVTFAGTAAWPWAVWLVPTMHVGVGALLLACSLVLSLLTFQKLSAGGFVVRKNAVALSLP